MSEAAYKVSYIAASPYELKVGDRVMVIDEKDNMFEHCGVVAALDRFYATIRFGDSVELQYNPVALRKLNNTTSDDNESDNVKAFRAIVHEMSETYKAKDADYGSAYDDGYRLFGHTQLLSRIYEKFSRVKHLLDGNKPKVAENVYDTLTDMAVQCICLRMLLQKNDFENVE